MYTNGFQKELRKRIEDGPGASLLDTMTPLLYRVSLLCYNKSHLPAVIEFTRTNDKGLGTTAHELLKEISTKHPKVFSTHVKDLCKTLEGEAPTATKPNPPGAVDDLKACAAFAKKFPTDIPMNTKESRKLVQSLLNFSFYGTPPQAAKHAITIIMNSDDKKELHAREILTHSIKDFQYDGDHWLTKLAALSQLVLLAQSDCDDDMDAILEIAIQEVLQKPHAAAAEADAEWMEVPDEDIQGRIWAIKLLVNRLRSLPSDSDFESASKDTYTLLNRFVKNNGEGSTDDSTPAAHKSRQRLLAANSLLKLSCTRRLDSFLTPADFVQLSLVTHDPCTQVRKGFAEKLMKYLGQGRLTPRFYTILFFLAHDPDKTIKSSTMTWIRARRAAFAARKETVLESVFARLLSLLAHHPDFDTEEDTLKLMSEYILYYLKCVATEENLSLIFHVAQRVKGVADGIAPTRKADENLYVLSDLAQALIRSWEEQNNWTMQSWPGKMKLPSGIFRPLESHDRAQEIAKKTWIGEDLVDELDPLVRKAIRSKKRKASDGVEKPRKKTKGDRPIKEKKAKTERLAKTPKKKRRVGDDDDESEREGGVAPSSEPRRKSDRRSTVHKSYVEVSSDEEEVGAGAEEVREEEADDSDAEEVEEADKSTPAPEAEEEEEEEDAEMADAEPPAEEQPEAVAEGSELSDPEPSSEPEPEPAPVKKNARGKAVTRTNGVKSSPAVQKRKAVESVKEATPPKSAKKSAKGKAKSNGAAAATPSSPATNGTGSVRRSGRTRG
jgi:sister-chromatid-cohesion protein PDS5